MIKPERQAGSAQLYTQWKPWTRAVGNCSCHQWCHEHFAVWGSDLKSCLYGICSKIEQIDLKLFCFCCIVCQRTSRLYLIFMNQVLFHKQGIFALPCLISIWRCSTRRLTIPVKLSLFHVSFPTSDNGQYQTMRWLPYNQTMQFMNILWIFGLAFVQFQKAMAVPQPAFQIDRPCRQP